jgi:arsenate reductase
VRVRPADPRHAEQTCTTSNQSKTGIYFITARGNYFPGMQVRVMRNFRSEGPTSCEEIATVVRVESLGGGHAGVALHTASPKPKTNAQRRRVLFVCIGNSCRSPMAEALARHLASDVIEPSSAGLNPLGHVAANTRAALEEIGVAVAPRETRPLRKEDLAAADVVINLTGHPLASSGSTPKRVEDWNVADPYGEDLSAYRKARDEIRRRVEDLARRLRPSVAR